MKKVLIGIGIFVLVVIVAAGSFFGIYVYPVFKAITTTALVPYDDKLTIITGGGGNTGILVSDSLVLVVDTKMDDAAKDLYEKVKTLANGKPILVVNTHIHMDHVKGNPLFKGQQIVAGGNYTKEFWVKENGEESLPTQWLKDTLVIPFGDETATIFNLNVNAHTQSDVMVYLSKRKMLFGGDVILNKQTPSMRGTFKSDPDGYLAAFEGVTKRFDVKTIVPGHGEIGGLEIIDAMRTYFDDVKSASADPSKESDVLKKYETWRQIPFLMSPKANIEYIRELGK